MIIITIFVTIINLSSRGRWEEVVHKLGIDELNILGSHVAVWSVNI